jgi:hypothetical protein
LVGISEGDDDRATDIHFREHPRDPHATPAGLVANRDAGNGDGAGLGDAADQPVQGNLGGGHFAVETHFALGAWISGGDGSFFFMDVKSEVECLSRV